MADYPIDAEDGRPVRRVTGLRVLAWLGGFFGVIFAANVALVWLAVDSFPGLSVESSYRAGQEFNEEVAAAAAQAARGWNVDVRAQRAGDGAAFTARFADKSGSPESHLAVTAKIEHPTDTRHDREVLLAEVEPGVYTAEVAGVAAGSWVLVIEAAAGGERVFRSRNTLSLPR